MSRQRRNNQEEELASNQDNHLGYSESTITKVQTLVNVYIDERFYDAKYYRAVVDKVRSLQEGDQLQYFISSPGGDMDGMITLIEANRNCEADILANIVGECHSAASMFALSCPNITVSPSATMMVHHVTYGAIGKSSDVQAQLRHTADFCDKYFIQIYEGFLTEEEIKLCIEHGREIWMLSDEIVERLNKRNAYFENLRNNPKVIEPVVQTRRKPKVQAV